MLHVDNALLLSMVRSAHDPDPARAVRHRPFVYRTTTKLPDGSWVPPAPGDRRGGPPVGLFQRLGIVRRLVSLWRPTGAACCEPACG